MWPSLLKINGHDTQKRQHDLKMLKLKRYEEDLKTGASGCKVPQVSWAADHAVLPTQCGESVAEPPKGIQRQVATSASHGVEVCHERAVSQRRSLSPWAGLLEPSWDETLDQLLCKVCAVIMPCTEEGGRHVSLFTCWVGCECSNPYCIAERSKSLTTCIRWLCALYLTP